MSTESNKNKDLSDKFLVLNARKRISQIIFEQKEKEKTDRKKNEQILLHAQKYNTLSFKNISTINDLKELLNQKNIFNDILLHYDEEKLSDYISFVYQNWKELSQDFTPREIDKMKAIFFLVNNEKIDFNNHFLF